MKKAIAAVVAVVLAMGMSFVVTGCSTMEGVGKDIERGGEKLQREARERR